jgi:cyclic beta-1,2-glucan synthetase
MSMEASHGDGKEYIIKVNKNNKLPTVWSHVLSNGQFGTLLTESMGGYTWKDNCKLKRITAWSNSQVTDPPSEVIYFKDMKTDKKWSAGLSPMPDDGDYYITYGFGYASYLHNSDGIEQKVEIYIPNEENIKVNLIHLENRMLESKNLKIVYYLKQVLDEDEIKSNGKINLEYNQSSNMIWMKNVSNEKIKEKFFISSSEKIVSYTGSKTSFFKNGNLSNPDGLNQIELNRENSYGEDGIVAISMEVKVDAMSSKDVSIIIGADEEIGKCQDVAYKYSNINNCREELAKTKRHWENIVNRVQVETPMESTNLLLNGWLIYQTIVSRLYARTGFYQSGGAYGYRDQLQDSMAIKYFAPQITRNQILKHSKHQFIEGDVEHWWHEENSSGIRTMFSDDLLWLAYVTADYISYTLDYSILDEQTPYRQGEKLKDGEIEKYDVHKESDIKESLYEHCIRAIEHSLKFGENDLPLIGSGDWNDGLSNVGVKGKGESVWLGFFMYDVLKKFIPICEYKRENIDINVIGKEENDVESKEEIIEQYKKKQDSRIEKYKEVMEKLKKALNTNAWDGRWYKRAFMDDGEVLGSLQNEECRIDSISQSWSVISGAGDNDKKYISMESLENHLIDKSIGIIKILDPPFEKSKLEPGYIKSYIPGTRENGGQYTHECCY